MRRAIIAALAATAFFAAPALAQTQGGQTQGDMQQGREQARTELQEAGFTNIQILDTAFLVSAISPAGVPVMMIVNPADQGGGAMGDQGGGATGGQQGQGGGQQGGGSGGGQQGGGSGGSGGSGN